VSSSKGLQHPQKVQARLTYSYCVIAALMFNSYDAIGGNADEDQLFKHKVNYNLLLLPMYQVVSTQNPFLFLPSLIFVLLATLLMTTKWARLGYFKNIFFTTQSMVVFVGSSILNSYHAHTAEQSLRERFKKKRAVELTLSRTESILNTLLPVMVVEELRECDAEPCHHYKRATVAQSDLCGFTQLASTRSPQEVVEFIRGLFGLFDELTDQHEVYKVETIGDAYIAGQAEPPLTYKNSPLSVVRLGLDMVTATSNWSISRKGNVWQNVSCRVGVHTGECIGGIVGTEMQRYHLFGQLMTEVEVLESTAPEGKVQISQACKEAVELQMRLDGSNQEPAIFEARTEKELRTSKGELHSYNEVGGGTYIVRSFFTPWDR